MADRFISVDIPVIDPEDYTPDPTPYSEYWIVEGDTGKAVEESPAPTQELILSDDAKMITQNQVHSLGVEAALVFALIGAIIGLEVLKIWTNTQ